MPKDKGIKLSPKYGVNPAIPKCFYCLEDKNEVILAGRMKAKGGGDADMEAPRGAVWDNEPCDKCKEYMKQGIILISVKDKDEGKPNPYRTGGWIVVKEDWIRRTIQTPEERQKFLDRRFAFVTDTVWDRIGFPRGEINEQSSVSPTM
jgi:hypothetical protein